MSTIPPTPELEQAAARLLLAEGIAALTFGRLSRATGVSDRMLVYRFGNKAALLERALGVVSAGLRTQLSSLVGAGPVVPADLLRLATEALSAPERAPVLATWFEVLAGATRQDPACVAAASSIAAGWHAWLVEVLAGEEDPQLAAIDLLVRLEGALVLRAAGLPAQEHGAPA